MKILKLLNKVWPAVPAVVMMLPAQLAARSAIELEGAISSVSGTTIQLFDGLVSVEARGAKIETDDENFTNISDFKPGTAIEVQATANAEGSLQATTVEVSDEKEEDTEIGGVIGTVDTAAQTFTIGPLTIAWTGQTKFKGISGPQAGQLFEAELQISGGRLTALVVEKEEADD